MTYFLILALCGNLFIYRDVFAYINNIFLSLI